MLTLVRSSSLWLAVVLGSASMIAAACGVRFEEGAAAKASGGAGPAAGGRDAGRRADGGQGGAAPVLPPCGRADNLADDFDGAAQDPRWGQAWADPEALAKQEKGALVLSPAPSKPSSVGYASSWYVDLRDSVAQIEISEMLALDESRLAWLALSGAIDERFAITQTGGMLYFAHDFEGKGEQGTPVAWDAVKHRHWRIREKAGTTHWETSPDAKAWTSHWSQPTPSAPALLRVEFGARSDGAAKPGSLRIESFNAGLSGRYCRISDLSEDFASGSAGPGWKPYTWGGCQHAAVAGQASFDLIEREANGCYYGTLTAFDLTGDAVIVRTPGFAFSDEEARVYVVLHDEMYRTIRFRYRGDGNAMEARVDALSALSEVSELPYDSVADAWWRIREEGGTLFFETAPDGANWIVKTSLATSFDVTALAVDIGVTGRRLSADTSVELLGYNTAP